MTSKLPREFSAGDTLDFSETVSAYAASDGWTLHYGLFNAIAAITLDSVADGDAHQFSETATATATWAEGRYDWTRYVTHGDGRRVSLAHGQIKILTDLAGPRDGRSHARKMLEAIEAQLENRATRDDLDMLRGRFKEREIERDKGALIVARDKYKAEVADEETALAITNGEGVSGNIKVRFTR